MMVTLANGKPTVVSLLQSLGVLLEINVCDKHFPEKLSAYALLAAQRSMIEPLRQALRPNLALSLHTLESILHSATSAGNVAAMQIPLDSFPSLPRKFSERRHIKADFHPWSEWLGGLCTIVRSSTAHCYTWRKNPEHRAST